MNQIIYEIKIGKTSEEAFEAIHDYLLGYPVSRKRINRELYKKAVLESEKQLHLSTSE